MSEYGHVVDVQILKLGDALVSDTASGATSLVVGDIADFDEDGGTLYLNGEVLEYSAADDDTSTITLVDATTVNAESGDPVLVFDTRLQAVATEHVAHVALDGEDEGDLIEATVAQHLIDEIPTGIRGLRGESVRMEEEDDDWRVVDVLGKANGGTDGSDPSGSSSIKFQNLDTFVLTAAGAQGLGLTYLPIDGSEHVYWNGLQQRRSTDWSRSGKTLSIIGSGAEIGDTIDVEYAHLEVGVNPPITDEPETLRFYLPSSGAASVSPAFGSLWEHTADADRVAMDTTPANTSFLNKSAAETTLGLVDTLARQFVGPASLPGGSVEGTFQLIVPASESTFAADAWLQCRIAVYSSDGTTHRGDLFSGVTTTTVSASNTDPNYEISTSTLTRILSGTLTPVDAQPGDRIVLEIGYRCTNPTTTARSVDFRFGDLTASVDYAFTVDLSATGNPRPWFELVLS